MEAAPTAAFVVSEAEFLLEGGKDLSRVSAKVITPNRIVRQIEVWVSYLPRGALKERLRI